MSTTERIDRERLASCLLACARAVLELQPDDAPPDLELDLADGEGLRLGDYLMDSLGFVEWMTELEDQLDVQVMDFADTDSTRTLGGLADAILSEADRDRLQRFCARWGDGVGAG